MDLSSLRGLLASPVQIVLGPTSGQLVNNILPNKESIQNWQAQEGGLPADIRTAGNWMKQNQLPIIGGTAAIGAAPFTGGTSLLGLLGLGMAGTGIGAVGQLGVDHFGDVKNYLTGENPTPAATPSAPASGNTNNLFAGYDGLLPPTASGNGGGAPTQSGMLPSPDGGISGGMDFGPTS